MYLVQAEREHDQSWSTYTANHRLKQKELVQLEYDAAAKAREELGEAQDQASEPPTLELTSHANHIRNR